MAEGTRTRTPAEPGYSSMEPDPAPAGRRGALRLVAAGISGFFGILAMALVLLLSPLITFFTGAVRLLAEIRDTAVRPRPFVGAVHGLPFLDPQPPAPAPADEVPATAEPAAS